MKDVKIMEKWGSSSDIYISMIKYWLPFRLRTVNGQGRLPIRHVGKPCGIDLFQTLRREMPSYREKTLALNWIRT